MRWSLVRQLAERHGGVLVALLAVLAFSPALFGEFLYDDHHVILNNRSIRDLTHPGPVLSHDPARPLLGLSWALNYAVGGLRPWTYHLVNLLIHAANAVLTLWLFRWMAARRPGPPGAPLLAAVLFAISPMAAETAGYVASRSTSQCALFTLLALRWALPALAGGGRRGHGAGLALFVLALLTKEEAASLPLFLLLLDLFFLSQGRVRGMRPRLPHHVMYLTTAALALALRRALTGVWLPSPAIPPQAYLLTQLAEFPGYLLRALVPVDPAFFRGTPARGWPPDLAAVAWAGLGVALLLAAWCLRRRLPVAALAVLWLAAGLLPSSSVAALEEMVVDHRAYLGAAGACWLLGRVLCRPGLGPFTAALLVLLAARSLHYSWVLADPVRAWQDAVRRAPVSVDARVALGDAYARRRDVLALSHYQAALKLDRDNADAWSNMGAFLVGLGRLRQAEGAFRSAARARPEDPRVHDNLGMVLNHLHRSGEARLEFELAVKARPPLAQPRINLAALLVQERQFERARRLLEEAKRLEMDEDDAALLLQVERVLEDTSAQARP